MNFSKLYHGDCLDVLPTLEENSVDTIITDPPAGITFMGKKWDNKSDYKPRTEKGIAVKSAFSELLQPWEVGFLAFIVDYAVMTLRVAKPGAMNLTWALPRTSDLTKMGLRLAGWEIRNTIYHLFSSGFPKSTDISKALDRTAIIDCPDCSGTGYILPNGEPPLTDNTLSNDAAVLIAEQVSCERCDGTGKIKGARQEVVGHKPIAYPDSDCWGIPNKNSSGENKHATSYNLPGVNYGGVRQITAPATEAAKLWSGWGTSLKPVQKSGF